MPWANQQQQIIDALDGDNQRNHQQQHQEKTKGTTNVSRIATTNISHNPSEWWSHRCESSNRKNGATTSRINNDNKKNIERANHHNANNKIEENKFIKNNSDNNTEEKLNTTTILTTTTTTTTTNKKNTSANQSSSLSILQDRVQCHRVWWSSSMSRQRVYFFNGTPVDNNLLHISDQHRKRMTTTILRTISWLMSATTTTSFNHHVSMNLNNRSNKHFARDIHQRQSQDQLQQQNSSMTSTLCSTRNIFWTTGILQTLFWI